MCVCVCVCVCVCLEDTDLIKLVESFEKLLELRLKKIDS